MSLSDKFLMASIQEIFLDSFDLFFLKKNIDLYLQIWPNRLGL